MAASNLPPGLQHYAGQIISVAGKTVAVDSLLYSSQEDYYTECAFTFGGTSTIVAANQSQRLFQAAPGSAGQGWTSALTTSQTNATNGSKFEGNELYLVTHIGFDWHMATSASDPTPIIKYVDLDTGAAGMPLSGSDMLGLGLEFFWTLQTGGGPERVMGSILSWPGSSSSVYMGGLAGSFAAASIAEAAPSNGGPNCPMRMLGEPIVFNPNIDTVIKAGNTTPVKILSTDTGNVIALRCTAHGFRMTLPA
jgi:hypothetical protein